MPFRSGSSQGTCGELVDKKRLRRVLLGSLSLVVL
jgi:hypothetical protein